MAISTDDRLDIQELYARYNYLVDIARDAAAMAELFVEEGAIYDHGRFPGVQEGRAAIQEFMQGAVDRQQGKYLHLNGNLLIDGSTEPVSATAYIFTINSTSGTPEIATASIYRDKLTKTADGWKFLSRRVGYPLPEEN